MNFHPFYRNTKEVVKKEVFQVDYSRICVQHDIFAQKSDNLNTTNEAIDDELIFRNPINRHVLRRKKIDFIIVGPFVQENTKATGECTSQLLTFWYVKIDYYVYSESAY